MYRMKGRSLLLAASCGRLVAAFAPLQSVRSTATSSCHPLQMLDVASSVMDVVGASTFNNALDMNAAASNLLATDAAASSNLLLSFTDQGSNLAGIFFQASLLPYLGFLYFLSFRANRIPALGNFGFQFVLVFVMSTIPSGILARATYGTSLANVDWLHGGAELLLTAANILLVLGFKQAMTEPEAAEPNINTSWTPRLVAGGAAALFAAACVFLPSALEVHTPFLAGLGNIPDDVVYNSMPWITHAEPSNALSIPTWAIHFSSIFEYLLAMHLVWKFAETTGNETWKGLTWGMLPLHASGICAVTYHTFYNAPELQFLVTSQAGLTLLGNLTLLIASWRIARSNGWTFQELVPFRDGSATSPEGLVADGLAMKPLQAIAEPLPSTQTLAIQLGALTLGTSYLIKYGELGLDWPFSPNPTLAAALILGLPALTAAQYYRASKEDDPSWSPLPSFGGSDEDGGPSLSMADVKKYGAAGTLAYVLTELAFWVVAFPVASTAYYQSFGHWPDVINEVGDRTSVLGFIFAGANVARLLVPLRLGAALALAPWVDDNLLSRGGDKKEEAIDVPSSSENPE